MNEPMTADRPTTVAEAVEVGARAVDPGAFADWSGAHDPRARHEQCLHPEMREHLLALTTAVLAAVGYADLLGEVERLRAVNVAQGERVRATSLLHDDCHHDLTQRLAAALATVARVEAVADMSSIYGYDEFGAFKRALRAALHPEKGADHE